MKKTMIIFGSALLVLIVGVGALLATQLPTNYAYDNADSVNYSELLDDTEGQDVYYFYQKTCVHCEDLKPTINTFYEETTAIDGLDFHLVDMANAVNEDAWISKDDPEYAEFSQVPADMKTLADIRIVGTPTMMFVKDGVVTDYQVGNDLIIEMMDKIKNNSY